MITCGNWEERHAELIKSALSPANVSQWGPNHGNAHGAFRETVGIRLKASGIIQISILPEHGEVGSELPVQSGASSPSRSIHYSIALQLLPAQTALH